jgi:apolipoprotein D and lipocalin family protein
MAQTARWSFRSLAMTPRVRPLLAASLAALVVACAAPVRDAATPLEHGPPIDLARYMGDWYVIANIPYFAERNKVATLDRYVLRPDGRIENIYVFRKGFDQPQKQYNAIATPVPGSGDAHWKIQFLWPFKADYLVLEVAPDYQWALIGHPSRKYAWVFARDPAMEAAQYTALVQRLARHGYDPASLQRVPQFAQDLGKPGYQ